MNQQSQPTSLYPVERGDELDLMSLWRVLVEYKRLIIIFVITSILIAAYYITTSPTVYKVEALTFSSATPINTTVGLKSSLGGLLGEGSLGPDIKSLKAIVKLRTRSFLIKHIEEYNLKQVLFSDQWNKLEKRWINQEPSDGQSFDFLSKMITVSASRQSPSGLIIFYLEWLNPSTASVNRMADILNNLIISLNSHEKNNSIITAEKNILFLKEEIKRTDVISSVNILNSMIEVQMLERMYAKVKIDYVFNNIEPAITPIYPEDKPALMIIFIGIALGVIFGSFFAVSINYFKR
jgi:hypothetical protein